MSFTFLHAMMEVGLSRFLFRDGYKTTGALLKKIPQDFTW